MPRTKKTTNTRRTQKVTAWVKSDIRAELEYLAKVEKTSMSKIAARFIEDGVRQKYHGQHSQLMQPIIETAIQKEMAKYSGRIALLLVRVAFESGQTRAIAANILGRQPGVSPELLNTILDGSSKTAKGNITRKTPQLAAMLEEVEKWFKEEQHAWHSSTQNIPETQKEQKQRSGT